MEKVQNSFFTAAEVAEQLKCSIARGYRTCRELNAELEKKGYKTMHGRVNQFYFRQRYGIAEGVEIKA